MDKILNICPEFKNRSFKKCFIKEDNKWIPCIIDEIKNNSEVQVIKSSDNNKITVSLDAVVPILPIYWINELLTNSNICRDLNQKVKRYSLNVSNNSARLRANKTKEIANKLSLTVFPIYIRNYKLSLSKEPEPIKGTGLKLKSDITDPDPVFSKISVGRASTVLSGLSTFGSYDKPREEISIVLLTTTANVGKMKALVDILHRGQAKFRGLEKTFAISFKDPIIFETHSPEEYLSKCKSNCPGIPSNSFFLVYCPERGYSRANYNSPYYNVKHFLLQAGFPSQMVDDKTINNPSWKDYNLALNIFSKAGHVPWVLSEGLPNADLFLGLSYSSIRMPHGIRRLIGYVNVFDKYGRWLYYKGNTKPIEFKQRNQAFSNLLKDIVTEYQKKARLHRIHIHHGFRLNKFNQREIVKGIKGSADNAEISFVYINKLSSMRLYDNDPAGDGTVQRGKYMIISPNKFYLSTTGKNKLGQKGFGTPKPVEVTVNRLRSKGPLDLSIYAQHILSLTRLNWASTKDFCREPITIKYATDIAYLMNVFISNFGIFTLNQNLEKTPWFL